MILGEERVVIDLSPRSRRAVAQTKGLAAEILDQADMIDEITSADTGEVARLKALGVTDVESTTMWAQARHT